MNDKEKEIEVLNLEIERLKLELELEKLRAQKRSSFVRYEPVYIKRTDPDLLPVHLHYHGTTPCYNNPCYWC